MRVVIPVISFTRSGGSRVLSRMATEWVRAGHTVTFIANARSTPPYFPTEAEVLWVEDSGHRVAASAHGDAPSGGSAYAPGNIRCLLPALNRYAGSADAILANHSLTAWPVFRARSSARKVYYIQAYEPEYVVERGVRALAKRLALTATYRLPLDRVVNAPIYLHYKALRARAFVPPGIDDALFHPDPTCTVAAMPPLVLGCIGRPEPGKGTRFVLDAYAQLRARGAPVTLRVAYGGVTPDFASLPDLSVVTPRDDAELAAYYRSLDVMIAPGTVQLGAPHYPVMEAMACGIPTVTTGYMPADATNAWLVPVGDAGAIAAAVEAIVADPAEARTRAARALGAMRPFRWPAVAACLLAHLEGRSARTD